MFNCLILYNSTSFLINCINFFFLLFHNDSCSLNRFFSSFFELSWKGDWIRNVIRMLILVYCDRRSLTFEQIAGLGLVLSVENGRVAELLRLWKVLSWVYRRVDNPALIRKMAIWDSWRCVLLHYEHVLLVGIWHVWHPWAGLTERRVMEGSLSSTFTSGLLIGCLSFLSWHIDHVLLLISVSAFLPTLDQNFLGLLSLSALAYLSHLYKATVEHSWTWILDRTFHARVIVRNTGATWRERPDQTWVSIALSVRVAFDSIVTLFWRFNFSNLSWAFTCRATISNKIFRWLLQMVNFFARNILFWLALAALDSYSLFLLRLSLGCNLCEDHLWVGMVMIVSRL